MNDFTADIKQQQTPPPADEISRAHSHSNSKHSSTPPLEKEFNSSSDTCTADSNDMKFDSETKTANQDNLSVATHNLELIDNGSKNNNQDSFDRNFDLSDTQVDKTVDTSKPLKIGDDEFSFIQNKVPSFDTNKNSDNSVIIHDANTNIGDDSSSELAADKVEQTVPEAVQMSPNKSIMKKTPNNSPKKNVVFTTSVPEIIHYPDQEQREYSDDFGTENEPGDEFEAEDLRKSTRLSGNAEEEEDEEGFSNKIEQALNHHWSQVRQTSVSSDDNTPPPAPPPHGVNLNSLNFHQTNNSHDDHDYDYDHDNEYDNENEDAANKDMDKDSLHSFKLHLKNLNNLSLNEKLDIFLNRSNDQYQNDSIDSYNRNDKQSFGELDQHLQELDKASKSRVESNIQHLSLDLQNKLTGKIENPLNSLSKSTEVPLKSAGSSQSSLQSLMDNNRMLPQDVNTDHTKSTGIELNDGIHGFSNDIVEQLIPQQQEPQLEPPSNLDNSDESQLLTMNPSKRLSRQSLASENEEFHDSFDNEYNNTEQSIMNLLSSASKTDLHENQKPVGTQLPTETNPSLIPASDEVEKNAVVKEEPQEFDDLNAPEIPGIKKSSSMEGLSIKKEIKSEVFDEPPINEINETKELSPSTEHEIEKPILKDPESGEDLEHHDSPEDNREEYEEREEIGKYEENEERNQSDHGSDEDKFDDSEASRFNIRDHVDDAWKFEDSNDADREDNDLTIISQHQRDDDRSEIFFAKLESNPLEINLSPNSSQSFEESPDRKSLAPPRSEGSLSNSPTKSLAPPRGSSVDIGIDATTPPTPVRKAREERLRQRLSESPAGTLGFQQNFSPPGSAEPEASPFEERPLASVNVTANDVDQDETLIHNPQPQHPLEIHDHHPISRSSSTNSHEANKNEDSEVLANSSNVAPPGEITLPPIEGNNYSSFEEITRRLNDSKDSSREKEDAFERSVSAEFDEEKPLKPTSFLSIWHSQSKGKRHYRTNSSGRSMDISNITVYDPKSNAFKLPHSAVNKKFTDVKVNSRRVVDPEQEDIDVENFLPELSQDSGFGNPFNNSINHSTQSDISMLDNRAQDQVSSKNSYKPSYNRHHLENEPETGTQNNRNFLQTEASVDSVKYEPSNSIGDDVRSNKYYPKTLKPQPLPKQPVSEIGDRRKSRFKVPSFEIKQSIARFSGRIGATSRYDDIFNDTQELERNPPTIKSEGMKTLPSMDKDDVQKILNTKRIMSQEEYSQLKMVGRKSSVIHDNSDKYDLLQQRASIYHADNSMDSAPLMNNNKNTEIDNMDRKDEDNENPTYPHIATELMKNPKALLSKDQIFDDPDASLKQHNLILLGDDSASVAQYFPDPDPELVNSPMGNVFRIGPKEQTTDDKKSAGTPLELDKENKSPNEFGHQQNKSSTISGVGKPGSPIKIGSPIKLVKKGSGVVASPEKPKQDTASTLDSLDSSKRLVPEPEPEPEAKTETEIPVKSDAYSMNKLSENTTAHEQGADNHQMSPSDGQVEVQTDINLKLVTPTENDNKSYFGKEISNNKLRSKNVGIPTGEEKHEKKPSMVSVPSMYTNNSSITDPSRASSNTLLNINNNRANHTWKQNSVQDSVVREDDHALPLERGRLFFRVVGLKNINLPDIPDHNGEFSVTLDNGVHCIKTPNYKVEDRSVLIGKEFELTVGDSLEFILTMKMNYEKPKGRLVEVRERKLVKSKNKLGRMFGSRDVITTTKFVPQDPEDSWEGKFARDGSFGRCYIDLGQYESKITYRTTGFDIPVFNEWETIKTRKETIKAKPYTIGQLEVKMLYIPRTELHESLPTSIKSTNDIINELVTERDLRYEGYMTQDGGDCDSLKRRYFKLIGTSLIAHSEFSHKTRAKINLAKIIDVIYVDNGRPETAAKARNFSDVLLVPDSFKIKFANGEIIDFSAPNGLEKANWVTIFETIAQHNRFRRLPWVKTMMSEIGNKSNNPWFNKETNQYQ